MSPTQGAGRFLLWWVNCKLESQEEFIGHYQVDSIQASVIINVILDVSLRLNVSITKINVTMGHCLYLDHIEEFMMGHCQCQDHVEEFMMEHCLS